MTVMRLQECRGEGVPRGCSAAVSLVGAQYWSLLRTDRVRGTRMNPDTSVKEGVSSIWGGVVIWMEGGALLQDLNASLATPCAMDTTVT